MLDAVGPHIKLIDFFPFSAIDEEFENFVVPSGNRIHSLLDTSFRAVEISEASPAWQDYVDFVDAIVLEGLKQTSLVSLKSMLGQIVRANMPEVSPMKGPISMG